jgi:hypothetical protein
MPELTVYAYLSPSAAHLMFVSLIHTNNGSGGVHVQEQNEETTTADSSIRRGHIMPTRARLSRHLQRWVLRR